MQESEIVETDAYILPPLNSQNNSAHYVESVQVIQAGDSSDLQFEKAELGGSISSSPSFASTGVSPLLENGGPPSGSSPTGGSHQINVKGALDCGIFKDTLFAVLFVINLVVVIMFAAKSFALQASIVSKHDATIHSMHDHINQEPLDAFDDGLPGAVLAFGLVALFATAVSSAVYLTLLMKYSAELITATIWASIGFFVVGAVFSLAHGAVIPAVISLVFAMLSYWWLRSAESRIEFASVILKVAVGAVKDNFCPLISVSLLMQLLQLAYILAWLAAFVYFAIIYSSNDISNDQGQVSQDLDGTHTVTYHGPRARGLTETMRRSLKTYTQHSPSGGTWTDDDVTDNGEGDDDGNSMTGIAFFLFTLSLYWGIQVCRNIVSSTVAGTIACWWFTPHRSKIVAGSLFRAFTSSFGTICFGSLLISIVQTLKSMVESARRGASNGREGYGPRSVFSAVVFWVTDCLISILERILVYVNRYALVYSAAYGSNFATSGARVWDLFTERGWTGIINDSLIGNTLSLGVFATACLTSAFAYSCSYLFSQDLHEGGVEKPRLAVAAGGFVLGGLIGLQVSNMIESAVASVFVFFAEDPKELQRNHPVVHDELCIAWMRTHPDSLQYSGEVVTASAVNLTGTASNHIMSSSSGVTMSPALQREVPMADMRPSAPMAPQHLSM
jgi:hypothetical protein